MGLNYHAMKCENYAVNPSFCSLLPYLYKTPHPKHGIELTEDGHVLLMALRPARQV